MEGKEVILLLSIAMTELQKLLIIKLHAKYLVQSQEWVDALAFAATNWFFSSKYATMKCSDWFHLALQIQDTFVWVVSQQQTCLEKLLSACVWGFATLAV